MGRRDDKPDRSGGEMRFFDELEAEANVLGRIGRGEGQIYDEGYDDAYTGEPAAAEDGLLEFADDGIPLGGPDDTEEHSDPVRIFVGRAAIAAGRHEPLDDDFSRTDDDSMVGVLEAPTAPIAAADFDEDEYDDEFDDVDDEFDEFEETEAAVPLRAPDNAPGMRLLTPEREESLDTDRAWPGLRSVGGTEDAAPREDRPSWLDALPTVQPRSARSEASEPPRSGRSWDAPLLDFGGESAQRPAWSLEDDDEELEAGDEDGGELPVHEPLSFGGEYGEYDEDGDYSEVFGAPPDDEQNEDEADTGTWNRLAVLASAEVAEREQSQFGVSPTPVWQAEDPGEQSDLGSLSSGWDGPTEDYAGAPGPDPMSRDLDDGPVLPPIQPMASVLQAELNARTPVQPKAVVLKTLDGIHTPPSQALNDPGDLRSRVPMRERRTGRVEAETGPVVEEVEGGSGRLLLIVAVTLLITVGAVWQWRSSLFSEQAAVPIHKPAVEAVEADPAMLVAPVPGDGTPGKEPPVASDPVGAPGELPATKGGAVDTPTGQADGGAVEEPNDVARGKARDERRAALRTGVLFISTDQPASVYVDGKRVGTAPMELPGVELSAGHYDIKVVPHHRGRTYRTNTRIDAGRVRNIKLDFSK